MGAIVGIDLGTSTTVVAHATPDGVETIADELGSVLIPSVVSFLPNGRVLVGYPARDRRFLDPQNTIFAAKRLMGRAWTDPALQEARKRLPYELRRGTNESVRVMLRGELYTMPEVSAFVLRKAKAVAESVLGEEVDRAVITVPANFNELQREATKLAGQLADLDVVRVINEPTAAALAYGYGKDASERIAVYDFGGGTFDLTLMSLFEEVVKVRATAGDMFLGGDDIDMAIAEVLADAFLARHFYDPRMHPEAFDQIRAAAERMKMMLSTRADAKLEIESLVQGPGGRPIRFEHTMTSAELDAIAAPFVDRTLAVCKGAFDKLRVDPKAFDQIVLVGGSTRMRLVRERVADFFGKEPADGANPEEAVALGAAIQAMAMKDEPREPRPRLTPSSRPIELSPDLISVRPPPLPKRPVKPPPVPKPNTSPSPSPSPSPSTSPSTSPRTLLISLVVLAVAVAIAAAWFFLLRHPQ
jgi:molecular chaperone DnaK